MFTKEQLLLLPEVHVLLPIATFDSLHLFFCVSIDLSNSVLKGIEDIFISH